MGKKEEQEEEIEEEDKGEEMEVGHTLDISAPTTLNCCSLSLRRFLSISEMLV